MSRNETLIVVAIVILILAAASAMIDDIRNEPTCTLGDINNDGRIDDTDLLLCKGQILQRFELSGMEYIRADMNKDNRITATDLLMIKRIVLGLEG